MTGAEPAIEPATRFGYFSEILTSILTSRKKNRSVIQSKENFDSIRRGGEAKKSRTKRMLVRDFHFLAPPCLLIEPLGGLELFP